MLISSHRDPCSAEMPMAEVHQIDAGTWQAMVARAGSEEAALAALDEAVRLLLLQYNHT